MEEPDRDPANIDGAKRSTVTLTASLSSEDSWTLLGKETDQLHKDPSGVQEIDKEVVIVEKGKGESSGKRRHDSHRSTDSQLDESSDGISIISECDATNSDKILVEEESHYDLPTVYFTQNINLKLPEYEPLTPPYTPDEVKPASGQDDADLQIKQAEEQSVETMRSMVEHTHPASVIWTKWIIFNLFAIGMVAILCGNSMRLQNRVDEINFEHEKRISELELENNILKNEMNKLRHLYTRSELEEQVQRAEFEWMDVLRQETVANAIEKPAEKIPEEVDAAAESTPPSPVRKVPPQDGGVKRKVVWSGDEEEPMLIVDKDYVLPAFCFNQDQAVQDDLFFEYSAKYCDVKQRKIEAKQKKAEFMEKKQAKPENYNRFIHPKSSEQSEREKRIDPGKAASPFNIDYQKAFNAIKAEGSVIVEALGSILDLSPEPEEAIKVHGKEKDSGSLSQDSKTPEPIDAPVSQGTDELKSACYESDCKPKAQKQMYDDDHKQRMQRPNENEYRSKEDKPKKREEKEYSKHKDGKPKGNREGNNHYDSKASKQGYREKHNRDQKRLDVNYKHEYGSKSKEADYQHGKSKYDQKRKDERRSDEHYHKRDSEEEDHYQNKFKQREEDKAREYKPQQHHTNRAEQNRGSGERPKNVYDTGEGSYLDEYKRIERNQGREKYDKHGSINQQRQQSSGDWSEERYKGGDEYRQNGGKHGEKHWQDRMKHGRQEARDEHRKQMEGERNWYLERGNQREEERIFQQPNGPDR